MGYCSNNLHKISSLLYLTYGMIFGIFSSYIFSSGSVSKSFLGDIEIYI